VFHSTRAAMPSGPAPRRGSDIYVMQADGSNVRRLTTTLPGRTTQNPAWSPDGEQIAFASTRDGDSATTGWDIYVMRADGTNIQRLTRDKKPVGHPRWSPDGRQLVFHSTRDRVAGTAADVELYVVGADGTGMRRITENQLYDGQADW
jgi:TolB protein